MKRIGAALLLAVFTAPAAAHSWYDGNCCNEQDCRQTTLGEVERRADGWFVVPTNQLIPFADSRIRRSLDPLIHICLRKSWKDEKEAGAGEYVVRCLYLPEPPV